MDRDLKEWSGRWDSNPRLDLGKVPYYPYTTTAQKQENIITSSARLQDRIVPAKTTRTAIPRARHSRNAIVRPAKSRPVFS